jgi:hypothetical protein
VAAPQSAVTSARTAVCFPRVFQHAQYALIKHPIVLLTGMRLQLYSCISSTTVLLLFLLIPRPCPVVDAETLRDPRERRYPVDVDETDLATHLRSRLRSVNEGRFPIP